MPQQNPIQLLIDKLITDAVLINSMLNESIDVTASKDFREVDIQEQYAIFEQINHLKIVHGILINRVNRYQKMLDDMIVRELGV